MSAKKTGDKGYKTEELIRRYFLEAGFYVIRSVLLQSHSQDLTDIDLWIYERSATLARRRTIIDIKDKAKPQAAERLFFVKGLVEISQVDGGGVATSDSRKYLRELARSHGVLWLDGVDLQRMKNSKQLQEVTRLTDEELTSLFAAVDKQRGGNFLKDSFIEIKSSVGDRFGPSSANSAIDMFGAFCKEVITAHPKSPSINPYARMAYFAASISAISLDFTSAESALRPFNERADHLTNSIRYGDNLDQFNQTLKWAEAAIRDYTPNGAGVSQIFKDNFLKQLADVPAEGLAKITATLAQTDALFEIGKELEQAAYALELRTFDQLSSNTKSYLGALLDFADVDRAKFATAWEGPKTSATSKAITLIETSIPGELFGSPVEEK